MKYLLFLFLLISPVIFCSCDCTENSLLSTVNSNINFSDSSEPNSKTSTLNSPITITIDGLLGGQILFDTNFVDTEGDYKLTISGLELIFNPNTFDFVYVAQNGSLTGVVMENITMDVATGTLNATNAQLNYFSRYGFVN